MDQARVYFNVAQTRINSPTSLNSSLILPESSRLRNPSCSVFLPSSQHPYHFVACSHRPILPLSPQELCHSHCLSPSRLPTFSSSPPLHLLHAATSRVASSPPPEPRLPPHLLLLAASLQVMSSPPSEPWLPSHHVPTFSSSSLPPCELHHPLLLSPGYLPTFSSSPPPCKSCHPLLLSLGCLLATSPPSPPPRYLLVSCIIPSSRASATSPPPHHLLIQESARCDSAQKCEARYGVDLGLGRRLEG